MSRSIFESLQGGECFLVKIPRRMHRDLVEACQEGSRERAFGEVVVSADGEPVKIETEKGYQLVMNSLE